MTAGGDTAVSVGQSRVDGFRLHRVVMPLRTAFAASHGTETRKHATIVEAVGDGVSGWGECAALEHPTYTKEFADGAFAVLVAQLAPAALDGPQWRSAVAGNPMAKAGLELAMLDLGLRLARRSLITHLEDTVSAPARRHVPAGLSIGITRDLGELLACIEAAVDDGYQRVRMKIEPGWDVAPLEAIRSRFPNLPLQVDANGAYTLEDVPALVRLEPLQLLMIEQPLATGDLAGHADLAQRLAIPICLDEPITSAESAHHALSMKACSTVNIKVARLGGLRATLDTLRICRLMRAGAWCGGMLDTGIGRAVNVAVAALDGFTSPGDIAATDRYFEHDIITTRFEVDNGTIAVPDGDGIGVEIDRTALRSFTTRLVEIGRHP